ncbi:MAG: serine/threonine protein kinase [Blastopirellula sp.]|nr:MAG: serine/threonine protein kinase [Blastopirellula sp.]
MNDSIISENRSDVDQPIDKTQPRRWRFRFSLMTMLVVILVASIFMAKYAEDYRAFLREQERIVPTDFDIKTGKNVLWSVPVGSVAYCGPVISGGKVFVGTNNHAGYLKRYPSDIDLGVLLCFDAKDGELLWQDSNEKLPTGRVHDWPMQGITSTPHVEGDRLWYVTNRCEVVCLDTEGFYDNEDDGVKDKFGQQVLNTKKEADTVWRLDMMAELGVSPHNASCSQIAASKDAIFLVTGQGLDESHSNNPNELAPCFLALDKKTGKVLWSDNSATKNILHGSWGSPVVAKLGGVDQVIFPGGDGWLYSFDPQGTADGKGKLLWKFDCNPKDSIWMLGGRATRNNLIAKPTIYNGNVYIAVGQDPEHGEGDGHLWCIDPTKRGDVSPDLVFSKESPDTPIPHRRRIACEKDKGEYTKPNPNSAVVWLYTGTDLDGNGRTVFEEEMHRCMSSVVIKEDLAFVSDTSGLLHCIDAKTGVAHWTYDLFAHTWSTPLISARHVYAADEDGELAVFNLSKDPAIAMPGGNPVSESFLSSAIYATPNSANNVLYILSMKQLHAISNPNQGK